MSNQDDFEKRLERLAKEGIAKAAEKKSQDSEVFAFPQMMTDLAVAAASMHELFTSFMDAGFAEKQALYIIGVMLGSGGSLGQDAD